MEYQLHNILKRFVSHINNQPNTKKLQNKNIYEKCIICGELTMLKIDTPIEQRGYYELGVGQLCTKCYKEIMDEYRNIYPLVTIE